MASMDLAFGCPFCMGATSLDLKFDRKGRPYASCRACGTRAFLRGEMAMNGLAIVSPLVQATSERMRTDSEYFDRMNAKVEQLRRMIRQRTIEAPESNLAVADDIKKAGAV
jgi:hypothetical protein